MRPSTRIFTAIFFFSMGMSTLAAKDLIQISGQIIDQNGVALPFANVALIDSENGNLITGAVSDENGNFRNESAKSGRAGLVLEFLPEEDQMILKQGGSNIVFTKKETDQ